MKNTPKHSGFTLIELSVVLIIITLIVGGIIVGRSLIRNAELQSVISDIDRFKKAATIFRDKYKELPGDFTKATTVWGTDTAACAAVAPNSTPKIKTCDGNGDGYITDASSLNPAGGLSSYLYEIQRAWQQLANAGLIEGNYSGAYYSAAQRQFPRISAPASAYNQNTFDIFHVRPGSYAGSYTATYNHIIVYGRPTGSAATHTVYSPGLTTTDAYDLDQKMDDGKPGVGYVLSYTSDFAATPTCATTNVASTAEYYVSLTGYKCSLIFITGF